jgi:hypothetical protein
MKLSLFFFVQGGFVILTIVFFALLLRELREGIRSGSDPRTEKKFLTRFIIALIAWCAFVSAWSLSGIMGDFGRFPFNFMPVLFLPLIGAIFLMFSKTMGDILKHIPYAHIIRLQGFRFFVEILLWLLYMDDLLPVQMSFEGRNFDVLVGITAPAIAWLASHQKISRIGLIFWNLAGLVLLINIVAIAILSTPSPVRVFMNEPANTIVTVFPISWLPAFLVPLAYTLHLLSLKQLLRQPAKAGAMR